MNRVLEIWEMCPWKVLEFFVQKRVRTLRFKRFLCSLSILRDLVNSIHLLFALGSWSCLLIHETRGVVKKQGGFIKWPLCGNHPPYCILGPFCIAEEATKFFSFSFPKQSIQAFRSYWLRGFAGLWISSCLFSSRFGNFPGQVSRGIVPLSSCLFKEHTGNTCYTNCYEYIKQLIWGFTQGAFHSTKIAVWNSQIPRAQWN